MNPVYPVSDGKEDMAAAKLYDEYLNKWFADPVLKGAYPAGLVQHLQKMGLLGEIDAATWRSSVSPSISSE